MRVRTLQYEGHFTVPADTAQRVTLLMRRNSFRFRPYDCQVLADSVHMAPYASPWMMIPSEQLALLIEGSVSHQPNRLRTITLRIGKNGFYREPFSIHFYQYNGPEQPPGAELRESITASAGHEGVFSLDVRDYNIFLPAGRFFIAVEAAVEIHSTTELLEEYTPSGPILRAPCVFFETRTWRFDWHHQAWQRATAAENCWPLYENALSVEVEPAR